MSPLPNREREVKRMLFFYPWLNVDVAKRLVKEKEDIRTTNRAGKNLYQKRLMQFNKIADSLSVSELVGLKKKKARRR